VYGCMCCPGVRPPMALHYYFATTITRIYDKYSHFLLAIKPHVDYHRLLHIIADENAIVVSTQARRECKRAVPLQLLAERPLFQHCYFRKYEPFLCLRSRPSFPHSVNDQ
jgi:hypothetical protein